MSSFQINTVLGWILGALILAMACGKIAEGLVSPKPLGKPAYMVAVTEAPKAEATGTKAAAGPEPIEPLLASADPQAGAAKAKVQCGVCHTFDKGGPNRVGPNLYEVLGEPIGEGRGFSFSAALSAHKGEKWSVDDLNKWLFDPKAFAPGTKMLFKGFANAKDRADVIAFLNTLSDSPKPLGK